MTGLPEGWVGAKIADVAQVITGNTPPSAGGEELYAGSIPFYRPNDVEFGKVLTYASKCVSDIGLSYSRKIPARSTLLVCIGSVGKASLTSVEGCTNQQINTLAAYASVAEPKWLFRTVCAPQFQETLKSLSSATTISIVNKGKVEGIVLPLPPLPEQRRIVRKLDTITTRTTTARSHLTTIEKLVERYKRAVAQQLIHAHEWETVPFLEACDAYQPKTISKSELVADGAYPVYGANGVIGRYSKYNHDEPQLLITCRGATCGTVNVSQPFSWITGNAMVVDGSKSGLSLAFLREYFAKGFDFTTVISGSAQPQITRQSLAQLRMPVVDANQQREIVRRIETAFAKIDRLASEAAKALKLLGHLDQRILAKAFAGELVPQDPTDEPAETLLARIREAHDAAPEAKRRRKTSA